MGEPPKPKLNLKIAKPSPAPDAVSPPDREKAEERELDQKFKIAVNSVSEQLAAVEQMETQQDQVAGQALAKEEKLDRELDVVPDVVDQQHAGQNGQGSVDGTTANLG